MKGKNGGTRTLEVVMTVSIFGSEGREIAVHSCYQLYPYITWALF